MVLHRPFEPARETGHLRSVRSSVPSRQKLASVPAHEFALSEDVALHGLFGIGLRSRRFQGKFRIECVELEKIPVRLSRWRTGATIAFSLKVVGSLFCPGPKRCP